MADQEKVTFKADLEDKLKIYETFRDYIKHEDTLRSNRTGWLLTIQGFLFAAEGALTAQNTSSSQKAQALVALIGYLVTKVSRMRAQQQDKVYTGIEEKYKSLVKKITTNDVNLLQPSDLPHLRYGALERPVRKTHSLYYELIFSSAWIAILIYLSVVYSSNFEVIRKYVLQISAPISGH